MPALRPARNYSLFITLGYFIIALIGVLHHEMWRDEFQAYLVSRDSHSFAELVANNKYEGHPLLWYTLLYWLTAFTENPLALQFLNLAFAIGAVLSFCPLFSFQSRAENSLRAGILCPVRICNDCTLSYTGTVPGFALLRIV
jgi:hypothetical protein